MLASLLLLLLLVVASGLLTAAALLSSTTVSRPSMMKQLSASALDMVHGPVCRRYLCVCTWMDFEISKDVSGIQKGGGVVQIPMIDIDWINPSIINVKPHPPGNMTSFYSQNKSIALKKRNSPSVTATS